MYYSLQYNNVKFILATNIKCNIHIVYYVKSSIENIECFIWKSMHTLPDGVKTNGKIREGKVYVINCFRNVSLKETSIIRAN